jgi:hypothetical protein
MKQSSGRKQRPITSTPSGRPVRAPRSAGATARPQPRQNKFLRWVSTSKWVFVLGAIILVAIVAIMYFRLTSPGATATPVPSTGTPQAFRLDAAPYYGVPQASALGLLL